MFLLKRLYVFVPLQRKEGRDSVSLFQKYEPAFFEEGIEVMIYDSERLYIPPTMIYLIGHNHIVANSHMINEAVIQRILKSQ